MRIKGKFGLRELRDCFLSFIAALLIALAIWGTFSLIALISWVVGWLIIAIILTPILFWGYRWMSGDIEIEDDTPEEEESFISLQDEY